MQCAQVQEISLCKEIEAARGCTEGVIVKAKEDRLGLTMLDYVQKSTEKKDNELHVGLKSKATYRNENW